jgi:hypothetical protein
VLRAAQVAPSKVAAQLERSAKLKYMGISYDSLFSGLVGAAFGVAASFYLNWFNRRRDSQMELADMLEELRHVCFHTQFENQKDESSEHYRAYYLQVKKRTFLVLKWCYPWEKNRLVSAWFDFKGRKTSKYSECDHQCDAVGDWKELFARSEPLLVFLRVNPNSLKKKRSELFVFTVCFLIGISLLPCAIKTAHDCIQLVNGSDDEFGGFIPHGFYSALFSVSDWVGAWFFTLIPYGVLSVYRLIVFLRNMNGKSE